MHKSVFLWLLFCTTFRKFYIKKHSRWLTFYHLSSGFFKILCVAPHGRPGEASGESSMYSSWSCCSWGRGAFGPDGLRSHIFCKQISHCHVTIACCNKPLLNCFLPWLSPAWASTSVTFRSVPVFRQHRLEMHRNTVCSINANERVPLQSIKRVTLNLVWQLYMTVKWGLKAWIGLHRVLLFELAMESYAFWISEDVLLDKWIQILLHFLLFKLLCFF